MVQGVFLELGSCFLAKMACISPTKSRVKHRLIIGTWPIINTAYYGPQGFSLQSKAGLERAGRVLVVVPPPVLLHPQRSEFLQGLPSSHGQVPHISPGDSGLLRVDSDSDFQQHYRPWHHLLGWACQCNPELPTNDPQQQTQTLSNGSLNPPWDLAFYIVSRRGFVELAPDSWQPERWVDSNTCRHLLPDPAHSNTWIYHLSPILGISSFHLNDTNPVGQDQDSDWMSFNTNSMIPLLGLPIAFFLGMMLGTACCCWRPARYRCACEKAKESTSDPVHPTALAGPWVWRPVGRQNPTQLQPQNPSQFTICVHFPFTPFLSNRVTIIISDLFTFDSKLVARNCLPIQVFQVFQMIK